MAGRAENICFISNHKKTFFFHEIAKELEKIDYTVHWIAVNRPLYRFLRGLYPENRVLLVNKEYINNDVGPIGEYKLNELAYGDRYLRYQQGWARRYLNNIQRPLYDFIESNGIGLILGELTWAHELLIHRICASRKELGCAFLNPHTIRIPAGRFAFFSDEAQSVMRRPKPGGPGLRGGSGEGPLTLHKPEYFARNDDLLRRKMTLRARLGRLKRFITRENVDRLDPTNLSDRTIAFVLKAGEELNRMTYRFVKRIRPGDIDGKKFVFFALHKQPEASIDVSGRYYEDQYANIKNIWRVLPGGWLLVVKEHTNAIGDRSFFYYRRLLKLANLRLIDENTDSHELIRRCELTVTVSGTVAYEAALMGKPSLTFAGTFFNALPLCKRISLDDLNRIGSLHELITAAAPNLAGRTAAFMRSLERASFSGIISDPDADPRCMSPENIALVVGAIKRISES